MKILFHLNSMGRGGAERVVSILSRFFAQKGYEVVVATQWFAENEYTLAQGVRRVSVGLTDQDESKGRLGKAWLRLYRLRSCIKKENPDLVISFCSKANFRSAFSLFGMTIPLLVSVRNNPAEDYAPHKFATWYMEKKAAGCVFQTPDAQAFFSKNFQKKSRIIFNPLSEVYLTEDIDQNDMEITRKKEIVTVGRVSRQKNQLLLVKAFEQIASKYPELILKIYGDVQDEDVYQELQEYIKKNMLQEKVYFMGTTDSLIQEISSATMFVLSSDFEGMPNALIEAMVMGIPSISTDCPCGGSALLIQDKVSGLLVPVGDEKALCEAMEYILSDSQRAENMGRMAKDIKDKVNPEQICQEWFAYMNKIIEEKD